MNTGTGTNIVKLNSIDSFKIINPNLENDTNETNDDNTLVFTENVGLDMEAENHNEEKINTMASPDLVYNVLLNEIFDTISDNSQLFGNKKKSY